jgi:hypothetical protein
MSIKKAKKALQKNSDLAKSYSFIKIRNEKYDPFCIKISLELFSGNKLKYFIEKCKIIFLF